MWIPGSDGFAGEFYQTVKKGNASDSIQPLLEDWRDHFLSNSWDEGGVILIPKPATHVIKTKNVS